MATTHREHLPGAYPDSNPATPNEQGQAPMNQSSIHDHSQRNTLHKSTDPRGVQNFSDSGIHSKPIENTSDVTQKHFYRHSSGEAVGGGFYNHGNEPTLFNPQQPRVSEVQRTLPMENSDREAAFGGHEYTFSKPAPTTAKEQGFREIDAREAPQQGLRDNSRLAPESRHEARRPSGATSGSGVDEQLSNVGDRSSDFDAASRSSDTSAAAPYWGDLPKASQGGIYNTVTGHGSARDDHDEHHHLPERSAKDSSDRAIITGLGTDVPSGGVYNTVAGHGSNDEESRRHREGNNDTLKVNEPARGGAATINSTDAVFDAPLAAVPEEKPLGSDSFSQAPDAGTVTGTDRKDIAPGFLPELAAGDDAKLLAASNAQNKSAQPAAGDNAKLLAASAAQRKSRAGSVDNANIFDGHAQDSYQKDSSTSRGSVAQNSDLKTQRAFPLTSKHATTADVAMAKEDESKHPLRHKEAFAAGAAGLGAGAAASHMAKKHQDDEQRDIKNMDTQENLGEDTLSKEWDTVPENLDHPARNYPGGAAAAAAAAPHRRKSEEVDESGVIPVSGSTLEKIKTMEEEKPLGEDTLDVWDTTPENLQKPASHYPEHAATVQQPATDHRLEKEPSVESRSSEDSSSKGEKKHRGLLGIFHRHKDEEDTAATEPPKSPKDKGRNKLQKKDAAMAGAGAAAAYGLAHHHKDDKDATNQIQRKSFSGPAANQPTEMDQKRRASEAAPVSHGRSPSDAQSKIPPVPAVGAVPTGASPHAPSQAQREHAPASKIPVAADHDKHDKLNSNTARAGMAGATLAGVAGGIGAAKYASSQDDKQAVKPEQDVSQGVSTVGAPAAAGSDPVTGGGMYHTENPRQAPADLEHPRHAPSPPAQHASDFTANPSGVKPNEQLERNTAQEPGYNMLMAGTPFGALPMSNHGPGNKHEKTANEPGNYNKLASGTPSGVDTTAPLVKDTHKSPINPADYMVMASGLPSHKSEKQQGTTTQQPGEYNHLNTGTPSGVAIDTSNVGRARSEDHPRQPSGKYNQLATGTPSGVNTGAQPSARRASEGLQRNDSEGPYNKLASGTPSGVKISPSHSRRGSRATGPAEMTEPVTHHDQQDQDGVYRTLASGTATGINVAAMHHNRDEPKEDIKHEIHEQQSSMNAMAAQAPAHQSKHAAPTPVVRSTQYGGPSESETANRGLPAAESQPVGALPPAESQPKAALPEQHTDLGVTPHHATTSRRTQDQYKPVLGAEPPQQFMSPEVMPDAYTTSVPGRNSGAGTGPSIEPATTHPMRAKHMSPEEMPSAYTASAPGHSGAEKINSVPQSTGHAFGVAAPLNKEAKHMSPEEMPSAYTTSAPGHSGAENLGQDTSKFNTNLETSAPRSAPSASEDRGVNPALAAASGAWAASSLGHGQSEGSQSVQNQSLNVGSSGKQQHQRMIHGPVLHKCQHCGQDNDVSDVLERVVERLKGESGASGQRY